MSSPASLTSPSKSSLAPPQLSPIHRIGNHLPNQKRSYLTPTKTCSPLAKRIRAEMATSPDMRRGLLVRQLLQRMPGITVTAVHNKESSIIEISEEDCSVVEIEHKPANLSQVCEEYLDVVEEHDNEKTDLVEIPEVVRDEEDCEEDIGLIEKPIVLVEKNHEDLENKDKYKTGAATLVGGIGEKGKKEKIKNNKVSISWKSVRRLKRKTKLFIFNDCVDGKAEILTVSQEDSQRMPVVLGGRRPMMLVPGIDYGLGEGEDVMVCPEEEREVRLATVEQYNIDSFCLEAGYLSLAEMAETPPVDNVVRKVKQKRRANGVKNKLNFSLMGQPEVSGCHWSKFTSVGWRCNKAMKKWKAIVLTGSSSTPIHTTFTVSLETVQDVGALSPVPCQTVSSVSQPVAVMDQTVDWASKYMVKYLVKNLVESAVSSGPSGVVCSTPLVGRRERKDVNPSILVTELIQSGRKELQGKDQLVERFVYKYFYKWKYQL